MPAGVAGDHARAAAVAHLRPTGSLQRAAGGARRFDSRGHRRLRNHSGGTNGFASWLGHFSDGTVVIVLSNIEGTPAKTTGCDIAAITFGFTPSPADTG